MFIGLLPFLMNKVFQHAKSATSDMPQGGFKLIEFAPGVSKDEIRMATIGKVML